MWPAALEGQRSVSELWERPGLNKAFFVELREKKEVSSSMEVFKVIWMLFMELS